MSGDAYVQPARVGPTTSAPKLAKEKHSVKEIETVPLAFPFAGSSGMYPTFFCLAAARQVGAAHFPRLGQVPPDSPLVSAAGQEPGRGTRWGTL